MKNKLKNTKTKLTHFKALLLALVVMFSALAPSIPMEAATKKVSISKEAVTMGIKETYQLKMKNTTKKVKWSSSNKSVATVNNKGVVTAKKKGTATITAKISDKKYICKVTVKKTSISKTKVNVGVNDTYQLKMNNTVSKVKWSTSDKKIATVSKKGKVTAKKGGTATITAKVNGKKYTCKVTVKEKNVKVTSVDVKKKLTLKKGGSVKLPYTVFPTNASNKKITASSNNSSVAKVAAITENYIEIYAAGTGNATITVKSADKKITSKMKVTVKNNIVLAEGVSNGGEWTVYSGFKVPLNGTYKVTTKIYPKNVTSKELIWSTSDTSIATVTQDGVVTGVKHGSCDITIATCDGSGKSLTTRVHVSADPFMKWKDALKKIKEEPELGCIFFYVTEEDYENLLTYGEQLGDEDVDMMREQEDDNGFYSLAAWVTEDGIFGVGDIEMP